MYMWIPFFLTLIYRETSSVTCCTSKQNWKCDTLLQNVSEHLPNCKMLHHERCHRCQNLKSIKILFSIFYVTKDQWHRNKCGSQRIKIWNPYSSSVSTWKNQLACWSMAPTYYVGLSGSVTCRNPQPSVHICCSKKF